MSYRDLSRKKVTLPSGATTSIRKLRVEDYLDDKGIPVIPFGASPPKQQGEARPANAEAQVRDGIAIQKRILCKCCDPLRFEDETLRIVDKPSHECAPGELAIEDMTQDDADFVVAEVTRFSGLTVKAAEAARPFLSEPEPSRDDSSAGEALRAASY